MTALWITGFILAVVIVLFSIHINVGLSFSYNEKGNSGEIEIKYLFFKIKVFPKSKPEKEKEQAKTPEEKEEKKKKTDIIKYFEIFTEIFDDLKNGLFSILNYIIEHLITIKKLNISAIYGTGDAMYTGILTGMVNGFVYNVIGLLSSRIKLCDYNVNLKENFSEKELSAGVFCILSTNVWHILVLGAIIIKTAIKVLFKIWRMRRK